MSTRRAFLKLAVLTGVSFSLAGCGLFTRGSEGSAEGALPCEKIAADAESEFDYVVVGSGAGGGPLAVNLAKAGYKVLLLEAGSDAENYHYSVPAFHGLASEDPAFSWNFFVRHYENEARQARDSKYRPERKGVLYPRAGTLGGCTAHNAMITVYPHNSDWDRIAQLVGDSSWHSENMRKYFERLERCQYVNRPVDLKDNPSRHGFDGWLTTSTADPRLAIKDALLVGMVLHAVAEALAEQLGRPLEALSTHFDPNDWRAVGKSPQGVVETPLAVRNGRRNGTREYIRETARQCPTHLVIKTNVLVTNVLLAEDNRAIGVEYLEGPHLYQADPNPEARVSGTPGRVLIKREVILSAGAFNSPQLLKLSGIGPKEELDKLGIKVRVDLPGVGENLQDRYEVGVVSEMRADFAILRDCPYVPPAAGDPPDACFEQWESGTGVYTTNGVALSMIKKSKPARTEPDLFIFGVPAYFKGYYPTYSASRGQNYFTWIILKAHTRNTAGKVTLQSADPREVPNIQFHYFDEGNDAGGEDLESVVEGIEFVRRITARAPLLIKQEIIPGKSVNSREQLKDFIKNEAWGHHASCSNKMGPKDDKMAVVDSKFRVYGTKNLRVVDASVFPYIPGFFIVSAVYMISEKASDVILEDARASPSGGVKRS